MTLRERLDVQRTLSATQPGVHAVVAETLRELDRTGTGLAALQPGDAFPDFLLPDTGGVLFSRADLLSAGPAVVTFFRGEWCPYCRETLNELESALPSIEATGATLVGVTPETGGRALDARRGAGAHYTVLADVDSALAAACGVAYRVPEVYRHLLLRFGVDLGERQGNSGWLLPIPATFVLDRNGQVAWSYVDPDFTHRAEPEDVLAALERLG